MYPLPGPFPTNAILLVLLVWIYPRFGITQPLPLSSYKDGEIYTFSSDNQFWPSVQDSLGFIWGYNKNLDLIKFDGTDITVFENDPLDSNSIQPTFRFPPKIYATEGRELWIKQHQGIDRLDIGTNQFQSYNEVLNRFDGIGPNIYHSFLIDSRGNKYIGASRGVFVILNGSDTVNHFKGTQHVFQLFEDQYRNIWALNGSPGYSGDFLFKLDVDSLKTDQYVKMPQYRENLPDWYFLLYGQAVYIPELKNSQLLLNSGRIFQFNIIDEELSLINKGLQENELVYSIFKHEGTIAIGTNKSRVLLYDPKKEAFSPFIDLGDESENQKIWYMFISNEGIFWIVGEKKTYQVLPRHQRFKLAPYPDDIIKTAATAGNHRLVGLKGDVFFNTKKGLIPVLDQNNTKPIQLDFGISDFALPDTSRMSKKHPISLSKLYAISGLLFKENKHNNTLSLVLYQYPYATKYFQFDTLGQRTDYYYCDQTNKNCASEHVMSIDIDKDDNLWIMGWQTLARFTRNDHSFIKMRYSKKNINGLKFRYITSGLVDQDQQLWVGYSKTGISRYNPFTQTFKHYEFEKESPNSLISNRWVKDFCEDSNNHVWVASHGGLSKWSKKLDHFTRYNKSNLLPSNSPLLLREDKNGTLWVVFEHTIAYYDSAKDVFHSFEEKDGYVPDKYSHILVDDSNNLFLQSDKHTLIINANLLKKDERVPALFLKDFILYKEQSIHKLNREPDQPIYHTTLPFNQNDFTIRYNTPEYLFPQNTTFKYQMEGYADNEWRNNGLKREVTFTNLDHGQYLFRLKCINRHGLENQTPLIISINILPPWYLTWWAIALWTTLSLLVLISAYRYQLNRQLAAAETTRLKELNIVKSRFYNNITHEFRTPLTIIIGMADQIKSDSALWLQEGVQLIKRNSNQLLYLVNQLLDLSKLEAGSMPLHYVHENIIPFVNYIQEAFHSFADTKDIRLHFLTNQKELYMDYDPDKMQNIVSNLLTNAIKFTPAGNDVYLTIEKRNTDQLTIIVRDTGIGIKKEELPFIFDRFYQADTSNTRRSEGTGIGLSICKEFVKLMGGKISVESEINKGTTFFLEFPITHRFKNKAQLNQPKSSDLISNTILTTKKSSTKDHTINQKRHLILLVEDNQDVILYLSSILSINYTIISAKNGQEGIGLAIENVPDLIVSDIMMPVKDGFELCQTLKQDVRTSHIPIILLTAKADQSDRLEGLTYGADAYLLKPFHKEELLIRIEKLIDLRTQLQKRFEKTTDHKNIISAYKNTPDQSFLINLVNIVEENLSKDNFGSPELCRQVGLSRSQVFRKLKAITGKSGTQFIRSIRLEKAKELLATTDLNVSQVCYAVGFSNPAYFSRVFQKEFGMSPSEFRSMKSKN